MIGSSADLVVRRGPRAGRLRVGSYVLIPTTTALDLGAKGRFEEKSYTVALLEDGKWYLVRVSDAQQLMIMREVYPEFTGIEIPRGSMEALKQ